MKSRNDLPLFLNSLGLLGSGAEIGVCRADFSEQIAKHWKGKKLFLIDPYQHQNRVLDRSDVDQVTHEANLMAAQERMHKRNTKNINLQVFFYRLTSVAAAKYFAPNQLDFVFLDALHDYRSVWQDLTVWFDRVRPGGVIAGHDYKNSCVRNNLVEVKRAVDNFFHQFDRTVLSTTEDNLPSWYLIK